MDANRSGDNGRRNILQTVRRAKTLIPAEAKDNMYWIKRRKNNEAARKSRDAKRRTEVEVNQRAIDLEKENIILRNELRLLKNRFGIPVSEPYLSEDTVVHPRTSPPPQVTNSKVHPRASSPQVTTSPGSSSSQGLADVGTAPMGHQMKCEASIPSPPPLLLPLHNMTTKKKTIHNNVVMAVNTSHFRNMADYSDRHPNEAAANMNGAYGMSYIQGHHYYPPPAVYPYSVNYPNITPHVHRPTPPGLSNSVLQYDHSSHFGNHEVVYSNLTAGYYNRPIQEQSTYNDGCNNPPREPTPQEKIHYSNNGTEYGETSGSTTESDEEMVNMYDTRVTKGGKMAGNGLLTKTGIYKRGSREETPETTESVTGVYNRGNHGNRALTPKTTESVTDMYKRGNHGNRAQTPETTESVTDMYKRDNHGNRTQTPETTESVSGMYKRGNHGNMSQFHKTTESVREEETPCKDVSDIETSITEGDDEVSVPSRIDTVQPDATDEHPGQVMGIDDGNLKKRLIQLSAEFDKIKSQMMPTKQQPADNQP